MLVRVILVIVVARAKDILVAKVIYLDKFLSEQISSVGFIKETFLSNSTGSAS